MSQRRGGRRARVTRAVVARIDVYTRDAEYVEAVTVHEFDGHGEETGSVKRHAVNRLRGKERGRVRRG